MASSPALAELRPVRPPAATPAPGPHQAATGPLLDVVGGDLDAPLVDGRTVRYVNLDNAASTPALALVAQRVADVLPYYASVHRGAGYASQVSTGLYEAARRSVGSFVGARRGDAVVFTRNTTDAINVLSHCVPEDVEVAVLDIEHHANLLPWRRHRHHTLPAQPTWEQTFALLEQSLQDHPRIGLVAITGSSNVTGEVVAIADVVELAHAHDARVLVDAAQLAPHRRLSLTGSGVDYVALSAHKLYAPFGSGALIGRADWLDAAPAYLAGGGAVRRVTIDDVDWEPVPARHEAGSPNVLGAVAFGAACDAIESLPDGALERHERTLHDALLDGLAGIPGVTVLRLWPDVRDRIGVATFVLDGQSPERVALALSAEHGIGVRDGRFCAHPLLDRLENPSAVRASLGVGSRIADVERLVRALSTIATSGPAWTYAPRGGWLAPSPDPRTRDPWGALDELGPTAAHAACVGSA